MIRRKQSYHKISKTMRPFRVLPSKKFIFIPIFCLFTVIIIITIKRNQPIDIDRTLILEKSNEMIKNQANYACKQPNLPVYSPELMKFLHNVPPINCSLAGIDWVKCEGSECKIDERIKSIYGTIKCSFTDIIRINDYDVHDGETTYSDTLYKLQKSDVVRVSCSSDSNTKWSSTLTGIRYDRELYEQTNWSHLPPNALKLNVIMFGFDSLSHNNFIRKLPKSYRYIYDNLNGLILNGYNIVGDGTPQALIPILTGKTELELPDTRKRKLNTDYVNVYPFIWNDFKQAGYVTGFFEDVPELGTFTYRLNGFKEQPTDHYMRTYYLASLKERSKWPKLCSGSRPRHKVMLDQVKNFFIVYKDKPKFLFGFHGELSHDDYNLIGAADDDFLEFLKDLNENHYLNDTLLIIMADHGHRFAQIRNTIQGKQEERLPFFSFIFPYNFKQHFRKAYENFQENTNKLTTPFDIYKTLKSLLDLNDIGDAVINQRSMSLFTKIPSERSCAHAYIEPHWCACLEWFDLSLTTPIADRLITTLIDRINDYTGLYRERCELLKLHRIHWIKKLVPNQNLIKFNKNADLDGFVADLTSTMDLDKEIYQIKIELLPGNSLFEASLTYLIKDDRLDIQMSDISRINLYGKQARCIEKELPHLRKYCYCKDE